MGWLAKVSEEVIFQETLERWEEARHVMMRGRENSKCKGPEVNKLLVCLGREGEPAGQHTERKRTAGDGVGEA